MVDKVGSTATGNETKQTDRMALLKGTLVNIQGTKIRGYNAILPTYMSHKKHCSLQLLADAV